MFLKKWKWQQIRWRKAREVKKIRRHFRPEVFKAAALSVGSEFRSVEVGIQQDKTFPILVEMKSRLWPENAVLEGFQPLKIARLLEKEGLSVAAVVATDPHFLGGDPGWVNLIKYNTQLAVVQSDFFIDPVQVYQSKAIGADAILVDVDWCARDRLQEILDAAFEMGLESFLRVRKPDDWAGIQLENVSGIVFAGERSGNSEPEMLGQIAAFPFPEKIIPIFYGFPGSQEELIRIHKAGFQALMLDNRFWKQSDFTTAFRQIFQWTQTLKSDFEHSPE